MAVRFSVVHVSNESVERVIMKLGAAHTVSFERRGLPCCPAHLSKQWPQKIIEVLVVLSKTALPR